MNINEMGITLDPFLKEDITLFIKWYDKEYMRSAAFQYSHT